MHLETRERVQTNEAKSKRRRASPTQTTRRRGRQKIILTVILILLLPLMNISAYMRTMHDKFSTPIHTANMTTHGAIASRKTYLSPKRRQRRETRILRCAARVLLEMTMNL